MRRPPGGRSGERGGARFLQRLEPRAAGGEIRGTGEHGEDVAASQHDGYQGVSRTLMAYSEDHIALAAEYALGTLDADERARVESMMSADKDFTAIVAAWEHKLGALNQMVGPVEPRPELWEKIRAAIGHFERRSASALPETERPESASLSAIAEAMAAHGAVVTPISNIPRVDPRIVEPSAAETPNVIRLAATARPRHRNDAGNMWPGFRRTAAARPSSWRLTALPGISRCARSAHPPTPAQAT